MLKVWLRCLWFALFSALIQWIKWVEILTCKISWTETILFFANKDSVVASIALIRLSYYSKGLSQGQVSDLFWTYIKPVLNLFSARSARLSIEVPAGVGAIFSEQVTTWSNSKLEKSLGRKSHSFLKSSFYSRVQVNFCQLDSSIIVKSPWVLGTLALKIFWARMPLENAKYCIWIS